MDADELRLDGNAAAGLLQGAVRHEMTVAAGTCANCRAATEVGALHVYRHAPGLVRRCPACGAVMLRIVHGHDRYWVETVGLRVVEIPETPAPNSP